jgi:hypothetical protein
MAGDTTTNTPPTFSDVQNALNQAQTDQQNYFAAVATLNTAQTNLAASQQAVGSAQAQVQTLQQTLSADLANIDNLVQQVIDAQPPTTSTSAVASTGGST